MNTIINNLIKGNTDISDEIITGNMLATSKVAADAYLNATLTSSTPELRAMYSSSLSEIILGNSAITDLAVNRGWETPYSSPEQQLTEAYNKSKAPVGTK